MTAWTEAVRAGTLFALDPAAVGGISLRSRAGPVRDRFMATLAAMLPKGMVSRRMPASIADDRLLGGLDLAATLGRGRKVATHGLLAEADGGVVVIAMAERLPMATAARLAAAIDTRMVAAERDGFAIRETTRFGVLALDEGDADEHPPPSLLDRLGLRVGLDELSWLELDRSRDEAPFSSRALDEARRLLPSVRLPNALLDALASAAIELGIASFRAVLLAAAVARAAAALGGRACVTEADAAEAAQLVLAPRATIVPAPAEPDLVPEQAPEDQDASAGQDDDDSAPDVTGTDLVVEAAKAAIPADLLARMVEGSRPNSRKAGRSGAAAIVGQRGRPAGSRPGRPRDGARLDVLATLRAAAPMQRLRAATQNRIEVRAADFQIVRKVQRARTTTVFVVDASGSSALHRLAEAKGAVELLLAECYVRRDRVALVAFRGRGAELVLSPTASLTKARRGLAALPGGGGTPLASGLDAATSLVEDIRRHDGRAVVVLLTDGRANVARDGTGDRGRASSQALQAAATLRERAVPCLLIDTSPRPAPASRALADAMAAIYLPLPQADAGTMARAVRAAST